jgi:hypothetical protein
MATITFDKQELVRELKTSGIPQEQAEAVVRTIVKSHGELVTKADMQIELAPIKADLLIVKWMMGVLIALAVAKFAKQFF